MTRYVERPQVPRTLVQSRLRPRPTHPHHLLNSLGSCIGAPEPIYTGTRLDRGAVSVLHCVTFVAFPARPLEWSGCPVRLGSETDRVPKCPGWGSPCGRFGTLRQGTYTRPSGWDVARVLYRCCPGRAGGQQLPDPAGLRHSSHSCACVIPRIHSTSSRTDPSQCAVALDLSSRLYFKKNAARRFDV